ncbi:hypothetical protein [Scytonema sp. NUACC26]|uniref:hypothetical protein n=1 Tax=Scytonema sp. NUACC26 TaxID=3140176 RepID=UPI0034DBBABF
MSQLKPRSSTEKNSTFRGASNKPVWQSPIVLVSSSVGLAILSMTLATSITPRNITHIRGDDVSTSAKVLSLQRKQHCQISTQFYQSGDTAIALPFANQPEKTSETTLSNSLSLLSQCQKDEILPTSIGQEPGTSLILALAKIQTIIANKRALGSRQPFVVTITLQATEPGKHQPNPNDFQYIKSLVESITRDKSVIAIAGPMGQLQNNLEVVLKGLPNQRICPANSVMTCVEWAFETGRKL